MFEKMFVADRTTLNSAEDASRPEPDRHIALIAAAIKAFCRDRESSRRFMGSAGSDKGGNAWRMSLRGKQMQTWGVRQ